MIDVYTGSRFTGTIDPATNLPVDLQEADASRAAELVVRFVWTGDDVRVRSIRWSLADPICGGELVRAVEREELDEKKL